MKPTQQAPKEPSAEEQRWRAAAEDPARVKRHLMALYVLAGIWCVLTVGWGIAVMCKALTFAWTNTVVLFGTFLSIGIGIVNNRRILAGKSPGKRFAATGLTGNGIGNSKDSKTNP